MHCKDVAVREVDFELTAERIGAEMSDWIAYVRTDHIVLRNGDEFAVVRFFKGEGKGLFRPVVDFEIVSLPGDTVYHEDPDLDIINVPRLAEIQTMYPGKTVVVKGVFSHVNVVHGITPLRLRVIDNVPPAPSKLGALVRMALSSGYVEKPIVPEFVDIDMADRISEVRTEAVMFPCEVSHLTADMPVYFLDKTPKLEHDVTLVGCHLSKRIYDEYYGGEVPFLNVCPADYMEDDGVPTITKCCKVKNGHTLDGCHAAVPWGATVPEVVEAINDLFRDAPSDE